MYFVVCGEPKMFEHKTCSEHGLVAPTFNVAMANRNNREWLTRRFVFTGFAVDLRIFLESATQSNDQTLPEAKCRKLSARRWRNLGIFEGLTGSRN